MEDINKMKRMTSGEKASADSISFKETLQTISDLKKENFSLKLCIYHYNDSIEQKCGASVAEMYNTNIDLKVELEQLKIAHLENSVQLMEALTMLEQEVRDLTAVLGQERRRVVELEKDTQSSSQSDALTQTDAPPPPQDQDTRQNLQLLLQEKDILIEQLQASVKSQDAVIDLLRNSGAGQGSGDQEANDADRQRSSLIHLQEMQDRVERSTEEVSLKDFLLAEREFQLMDQALRDTIQMLKRKLQLQLALEKDSPQNDKWSETEEVVDCNSSEEDIIGQLQASLQEKEEDLQTLNNLLFSHEDAIHALENDLADQKIKCDSEMMGLQELQDALEQSREEMEVMSVVLAEKDIKLTEQKATIQTLNCQLKELEATVNCQLKDKLPQVYTCSDSTTPHQQESVLQQQLRELEDTSERAREEMPSVTEEKFREIDQLHRSLRETQMNPPTQDNLLSHIQDAINSAKDEILTAVKGKENDNSSNLSLQLSNCQLEIERLQGQAEKSNQSVDRLELKLKEMEDILVQTPEKHLEDNHLTEEKLQGQTEDSNSKVEQLELRLEETEAMLAQPTIDKDRCDRCLQILQRENGSLLDRVGASESFNETLHSQLDIGSSFTPSSVTVDKEPEDDRCMAKMNQNLAMPSGALEELLGLVQQQQESLQESLLAQGQLENHRAQMPTQHQPGKSETGPDLPGFQECFVEASEFTQLQTDYNTLREERERLRDDLTYAVDKNGALQSALSSTQEEINRLKGETDAYQKQLAHSHELLKMLPVEKQESKQLKAPTVSPTDSADNPKLSQLSSEIQKIKAQLTDKDVLRMKHTEGKPLEIININYVECRASSDTTGRRDHAKKDNNNMSQSSQSMDDPSSINSSLSTLCSEKTLHVTAQNDDYITHQRLIAESKTLSDKMVKLIQEFSDNSHPESQSTLDQFIKHLSCHLLKLQGSSHLMSDSGNNGQTKEENLKLKKENERLRRERSQHKKNLSEAFKALQIANRTKLDSLFKAH